MDLKPVRHRGRWQLDYSVWAFSLPSCLDQLRKPQGQCLTYCADGLRVGLTGYWPLLCLHHLQGWLLSGLNIDGQGFFDG